MSNLALIEEKPARPKQYVITARDTAILTALAKYRYLTTNDVKRLFFAKNLNSLRTQQRLKLLADVGLIDRMMQYHYDGRRKMFSFFLSDLGYRYLEENGHSIPNYVSRHAGKVSYLFLQHTLDIIHFWITLELSLQQITATNIDLSFIPDFEIRKDALLKSPKQNIKNKDRELYQEIIVQSKRFILYPDALFTLTAKDEEGGEETKMFALEIDRGSEVLETIRQKCIAFDLAVKQGKFKKYGDPQSLTVLIQCSSPKRLNNIREILIGTAGEHLVWVTSVQEVSEDTLLQRDIWIDGRGKRRAILG